MNITKALKAALQFVDVKADEASATRYVRLVGHVYDHTSPTIEVFVKNAEHQLVKVQRRLPTKRGFVSSFNGKIGVVIPLDVDERFEGDVAIEGASLKQTMTAGLAKSGLASILLTGEKLAWFYSADGTASSCKVYPGSQMAPPPVPGVLHPFPDIYRLPLILHAASDDEADRPTLCGVRLNGEVAEAADEDSIAVLDLEKFAPLPGPVVVPTALLKNLPKPGKIPPAIAEAQGRLFVLVGEELRFTAAVDRAFTLPILPRGFDRSVAIPRAKFANAVKFAIQKSPEDVCELTFRDGELHVCGCAPGAYTSHEVFQLQQPQPPSTRWVRGRLLHACLLALDEYDSVNLCYLEHPDQPFRVSAGAVREVIQPLIFPQRQDQQA